MTPKPALLRFKFDNFADLPSDVDEFVFSETQIDCNGKSWKVKLYPGGESEHKEGSISVYVLGSEDPKEYPFDAKLMISIKDANKSVAAEWVSVDVCTFTGTDEAWGALLLQGSEILDDASKNILKDGALNIDVTIQLVDEKNNDLYDPADDYVKDKMVALLESGERSDVSFNVEGEIFRVHSAIIHNNAPILGKYCDKHESNGEVIISDVPSDVFQLVLKYVYSGDHPDTKVVLKKGKEIIDAANRYELVNLKLAIETALVRQRVLDKKNVADYILFADAQSCALLKEYAVSFFLLHAKEILKSEHSKRLRESSELLSEIVMLTNDPDEEDFVTVTELRKELGKRKLDVDGSKEALMSRLKEAKKQKTIAKN
jgi:speckle-type POZ protein